MVRALVIGGNGMIGAGISRALGDRGIEHVATTRNAPRPGFIQFNAMHDDSSSLVQELSTGDFIINAIGLIKQKINENYLADREAAIRLNALFPHELVRAAAERGVNVLQIATDCVYSGKAGEYSESALQDATDVYGKTKSLGEVQASNIMHLRTSVIGPELNGGASLFEWVRGLPQGETINGFVNHKWNGVTSEAFGRIVAGIIAEDLFTAGTHHIVPDGWVDKRELCALIARVSNRDDLQIVEHVAPVAIDRRLVTNNPELNLKFWKAGQYKSVPKIPTLISEITLV